MPTFILRRERDTVFLRDLSEGFATLEFGLELVGSDAELLREVIGVRTLPTHHPAWSAGTSSTATRVLPAWIRLSSV